MLGRLAFRNAKRSIRDYFTYLITITLSFSLIFAFHLAACSEEVTAMSKGMEAFRLILGFVNVIILFVVCFLINYTTKFIFEKRSKELGTYMLLGIKKKDIANLFVLETILLGFLSLLLSIPIGLVISQFISLMIVNVFGIPEAVFISLNLNSLGVLIIYFMIVYCIVLWNLLGKIKRMTVYNFLCLDKQNERNLFGSRQRNLIFVCSLVMGISSIWLWYSRFRPELLGKRETLPCLLLSIIGVIISIYGISASFAEIACTLVINSRKLKYQKDWLLITRTFASKARTMGVTMGTLSVLALLSILALTISHFNKGIYQNNLNQEAPYDVSIYDGKAVFGEYKKVIQEDYTIITALEYTIYKEPDNKIQKLYDPGISYDSVMKVSEYNQLLEMRNMAPISLQENEYVLVTSRQSRYLVEQNESLKQIKLSGGAVLRLKEVTSEAFWYSLNHQGFFVMVIPDQSVIGLEEAESHLVVDTKEETKASLETKLQDRIGKRLWVQVRGSAMEESNSTIAMMSSIFLYLSFIFIAVVGTIFSIQALSDSAKFRCRYLTLRKLGVNDKSLFNIIRKQLVILFGVPVIYPVFINFCLAASINQVYHVLLKNQYTYLFYFAGGLAVFFLIYAVYWTTAYLGFKRNINEER